MLKRLYGEEDLTKLQDEMDEDEMRSNQGPKEIIRARLERRKDFEASYYMFTLVSCFRSLCCCFARCFKDGKCRRHLDSHAKFLIAKKRLRNE